MQDASPGNDEVSHDDAIGTSCATPRIGWRHIKTAQQIIDQYKRKAYHPDPRHVKDDA